jgi:hypothetical protein
MIAKLGFVLLFIAFGALMFLLGMNLPDSLRKQIPLLDKLVPTAAVPGKANSPAAAPPAAAAEAAGKPKEAPPPLSSFLLPTETPKEGRYALQVGLFPSQAEADALAARIDALHLPKVKAASFAVRDRAGHDWWLASAGERGSPDDLAIVQTWLQQRLGLAEMPVILLPAAKP